SQDTAPQESDASKPSPNKASVSVEDSEPTVEEEPASVLEPVNARHIRELKKRVKAKTSLPPSSSPPPSSLSSCGVIGSTTVLAAIAGGLSAYLLRTPGHNRVYGLWCGVVAGMLGIGA
ncbi:hypothetical protein EV182_002131, partial [Spiromyces aspiralis]